MNEPIVIGNCTLYRGDCLEVMPTLPLGSIDMVMADLPYGTTACKWDSVIPFEPLWACYKLVIKPNGAIGLFGSQPFTSILTVSNLPMYRYDWIWQKDKAANFMFGNKMPLKTAETVSVFYSKQPTYNPQKTVNPAGTSKRHLSKNPSKISKNVRDVMGDGWKETAMDDTQNYHGASYEPDKLLPKQIICFARESRGKLHPTQKPVALMEYLIRTYTNEGETVLDNTFGSCTTGVACVNTGRKFIGIELDPTYFAIGEKRVREAMEKKTLSSCDTTDKVKQGSQSGLPPLESETPGKA